MKHTPNNPYGHVETLTYIIPSGGLFQIVTVWGAYRGDVRHSAMCRFVPFGPAHVISPYLVRGNPA